MHPDFTVRSYPPHFLDVKHEIASGFPDFEARITKAWKEIIAELAIVTDQIHDGGPNVGSALCRPCKDHCHYSRRLWQYIPQIKFDDLETLSAEQVSTIRRRGCVVIRDVIDDDTVIGWRESLKEFARTNPGVEGKIFNDQVGTNLHFGTGIPVEDKQFFEL
jgi:hypothetical protein